MLKLTIIENEQDKEENKYLNDKLLILVDKIINFVNHNTINDKTIFVHKYENMKEIQGLTRFIDDLKLLYFDFNDYTLQHTIIGLYEVLHDYDLLYNDDECYNDSIKSYLITIAELTNKYIYEKNKSLLYNIH